MKKIILAIDGMTCSACSSGLEKYLKKQKGIENVNVNLVMANASITYNEKIINQGKIEEQIKQAGFISLGEFKEIKIEHKNKQERRIFFLFTILALLIMYISMGHMIGLPIIKWLDPSHNPSHYTVILFLLSIPFIIYGRDILKNGYKNLIHQTPNMDTLVAIGVVSSFLYSLYTMYQVLKGQSANVMNLYFESSSIVIYFLKLGRYIDRQSKDKTKEAIQKLVTITPNKAVVKDNTKEKIVTLDEIKKGDTIIVKPGEKIAVDGKIILGKTHVDESFLTGESKPVTKQRGDNVIAGSINYDGYIEYTALRIGKDSTISEIVRLVIEASSTKPKIAKLADTVSSYFVPVVIVIAIVTSIIYLLLHQPINEALSTFATILVVACPCSLGLATPLAIVISEGLCANHGILVKKSEILETARKIDTIVFDKTGTLTYGTLKIQEIRNKSNQTNKEILRLVGSIELKSNHPIAQAFKNYLEEEQLEPLPVENFENKPGLGIKATINKEEFLIGNRKILEEEKIENPYQKEEENLSKKKNSIVYVIKERQILAIIGVNDIVKENAKEIIAKLNHDKIETFMLTGDNKDTAIKIAKELGIKHVIANVLPKEKSKIIAELKANQKKVMMCGDGINDSPALSCADIGVSLNSGSDIAMDSADVILTSNNLKGITDLILISKKTTANIKQNLFWAFIYNALMIPIACGLLKPFGVFMNPMIASVAMVMSSLTVILNASRLRKIKI